MGRDIVKLSERLCSHPIRLGPSCAASTSILPSDHIISESCFYNLRAPYLPETQTVATIAFGVFCFDKDWSS
jgi:hypothetical protein